MSETTAGRAQEPEHKRKEAPRKPPAEERVPEGMADPGVQSASGAVEPPPPDGQQDLLNPAARRNGRGF